MNKSAGLLALDAVQNGATSQGQERLTEAFFKKVAAINKLVDSKEVQTDGAGNPIGVKQKRVNKSTPEPRVLKPSIVTEDVERPFPQVNVNKNKPDIKGILENEKKGNFGIRKELVDPSDIEALLSGKKPQRSVPSNNYDDMIQSLEEEVRSVYEQPKYEVEVPEYNYDDHRPNSQLLEEIKSLKGELAEIKKDIRKFVNEEVTNILFKEALTNERLKPIMESVFRDVINTSAKQILIETLKSKKDLIK